MRRRGTPGGQRGSKLIELMIAIVLGLFIIAGLISFFVANKQAYRSQEALARLQENARFALDIVNREARKAGYTEPFVSAEAAFPAVTGQFADGQVVSGSSASLTLRYRGSGPSGGDGWVKDCLGANVPAGALATVTLSTADGTLQCAVNGGSAEGLLAGVQGINIAYGEDTNGDDYADRYVASAGVGAKIASIRIELLLVSAEDGLTDAPQPYTFGGVTTTPTDRRLRRVAANVISLRNCMP